MGGRVSGPFLLSGFGRYQGKGAVEIAPPGGFGEAVSRAPRPERPESVDFKGKCAGARGVVE